MENDTGEKNEPVSIDSNKARVNPPNIDLYNVEL